MIQNKPESDLQTLMNLAEHKANTTGGQLCLYRTEFEWTVAPVDLEQIKEVAGYESLHEALIHYITGR